MTVWLKIAAVFAGLDVSESLLFGFFRLVFNMNALESSGLSEHAQSVLKFARDRAHFKRVKFVPLNDGPALNRYTVAPGAAGALVPKTHTMMFGNNVWHSWEKPGVARMTEGGRAGGCLSVGDESREQFHLQLYNMLKYPNPHITNAVYSIVEIKPLKHFWRLHIDVDFVVAKEGQSVAAIERGVPHVAEDIRSWLQGYYGEEYTVETWWKQCAWRFIDRKTVDERTGPVFRGGIHVYTNVLVNEESSAHVGNFLQTYLRLVPGMTLDNASFTSTGLRIDGTYKVVACPDLGDSDSRRSRHNCTVCHGKRNVTIAPPYALDATYTAWRRCLLYPDASKGETAAWKVPDHLMKTKNTVVYRKKVDSITTQRAIEKIQKEPVPEPARAAPVDLAQRDAEEILKLVERDVRVPFENAHGNVVREVKVTPLKLVKMNDGSLFVNLKQKDCPFKGAPHSSSTLYLYCNPVHRSVAIRCRHKDQGVLDPYKCGKTPRAEKPVRVSDQLLVKLFGPAKSGLVGEDQASAKRSRYGDKLREKLKKQKLQQEKN